MSAELEKKVLFQRQSLIKLASHRCFPFDLFYLYFIFIYFDLFYQTIPGLFTLNET